MAIILNQSAATTFVNGNGENFCSQTKKTILFEALFELWKWTDQIQSKRVKSGTRLDK